MICARPASRRGCASWRCCAREELAVLELTRVLGQSQPRVSRHLKLLTEAGLVERFPGRRLGVLPPGRRRGRRAAGRATCSP